MSCAIGRCPGPLNCYGFGKCKHTLASEDISKFKASDLYKPQVLENLAWLRFYRDLISTPSREANE